MDIILTQDQIILVAIIVLLIISIILFFITYINTSIFIARSLQEISITQSQIHRSVSDINETLDRTLCTMCDILEEGLNTPTEAIPTNSGMRTTYGTIVKTPTNMDALNIEDD